MQQKESTMKSAYCSCCFRRKNRITHRFCVFLPKTRVKDNFPDLNFWLHFIWLIHINQEAEVREARKLKASYENTELLKEKLLEEKSRRERVEQELAKLREVQQSMNQLEDELSSWKFLIRDIPGVSCSEDIPVKFAALQKYENSFTLTILVSQTGDCFTIFYAFF